MDTSIRITAPTLKLLKISKATFDYKNYDEVIADALAARDALVAINENINAPEAEAMLRGYQTALDNGELTAEEYRRLTMPLKLVLSLLNLEVRK